MSQELIRELTEVCETRVNMYTLLSALYKKELTIDFAEEIAKDLTISSSDEYLNKAVKTIVDHCKRIDEDLRTELASQYVRIFYGIGPKHAKNAFPYESVYTSVKGVMMQDAYSEVFEVYQNAGLQKDESFTEPEDHLAVELSYMGFMTENALKLLKEERLQCVQGNLEAQREFLSKHLLNWVPNFCADVKKISKDGFYDALAVLTESYLKMDMELLNSIID